MRPAFACLKIVIRETANNVREFASRKSVTSRFDRHLRANAVEIRGCSLCYNAQSVVSVVSLTFICDGIVWYRLTVNRKQSAPGESACGSPQSKSKGDSSCLPASSNLLRSRR